jgi:molybdopterin-guanine dinucleotide biosynthesis protein B
MPEATLRPVLDLNDPYAISEWLVANEDRFDYKTPLL